MAAYNLSQCCTWLVQDQKAGTERPPSASSSIDHESGDLLRHCVDNEGEEQSEDDEDSQSDDVLFELPPDQVDEGLHGVDEPGKAGGWTTRGRQEMVYIFSATNRFHPLV